jgi:hypothetical protein
MPNFTLLTTTDHHTLPSKETTRRIHAKAMLLIQILKKGKQDNIIELISSRYLKRHNSKNPTLLTDDNTAAVRTIATWVLLTRS